MKNIRNISKIFVFISLVILLSACSSTRYVEYSGKERIRNGNGGAMETVEGVDIWSSEGPPSKYEIIGVIHDQRKGGLLPMALLEKSIANRVKQVEGEAAILIDQNKATSCRNVMHINTVGSTTYSHMQPSCKTDVSSQYYVIKYFEE